MGGKDVEAEDTQGQVSEEEGHGGKDEEDEDAQGQVTEEEGQGGKDEEDKVVEQELVTALRACSIRDGIHQEILRHVLVTRPYREEPEGVPRFSFEEVQAFFATAERAQGFRGILEKTGLPAGSILIHADPHYDWLQLRDGPTNSFSWFSLHQANKSSSTEDTCERRAATRSRSSSSPADPDRDEMRAVLARLEKWGTIAGFWLKNWDLRTLDTTRWREWYYAEREEKRDTRMKTPVSSCSASVRSEGREGEKVVVEHEEALTRTATDETNNDVLLAYIFYGH
ncbi:unnamed protein product [Amoebophrya sp. A25]|nr:unnamed protein product [Amoebophrya sp. A25]|eukprot:GSA25T00020266001.1